MTKQEYYDLLIESTTNGNFPCYEENKCVYRSSKGQRCAIGLLISDEKYHEKIETLNVNQEPVWTRVEFPDGLDRKDLYCIQRTHDVVADCWDRTLFIQSLNKLDCFKNIKKVEV